MRTNRFRVLPLVVILVALSSPAFSQVRLYDWTNCTGDYVEVGHEQHADLSTLTWPGGGTVNDDISSVWIPFWDPDWEVYACDHANFNGGCSKQFDLDDEIGWGCINMSGTGWDPDELPPNQDISSIIIQPSTHTRYFEEHGYKERYDPGGGRVGYIEVWTDANFEGMNYKMAFSDPNWSNHPPKHIESIRVYGEILGRLCTSGYGTCTDYEWVKVRDVADLYADGYLDPNDEVTGLYIHYAIDGSVFATSSMDNMGGSKYFLTSMTDATGTIGPTWKKNSHTEWSDEYGDINWPAGCFNQCNSNESAGCPAGNCGQVCSDAIRQFMGMYTYENEEWAADASLTIIGSHGEYAHSVNHDDVAKLLVMDCQTAWCNWDLSTEKEASVWYSRDWYDYNDTLPDHDHEYGRWNTDWLLVLGCHSLGHIDTLFEFVAEQAYDVLRKSGVHGVGGFRGPATFVSDQPDPAPAIEEGESLAIALWNYLDRIPVSSAWLFTMASDGRIPAYITSEDCVCTDPTCVSRWDNDFYFGTQSGPMVDIRDAQVSSFCYNYID